MKKKSNKLVWNSCKVFFIPLYSLTFEPVSPSTLYHSCPFHSGALIVPDQALSNFESRDLSQGCQKWANSQNDNYFHSKWQLLSETNCHFVNWVIFDNSHFLLSLTKVTSFNWSKLEQMPVKQIWRKSAMWVSDSEQTQRDLIRSFCGR